VDKIILPFNRLSWQIIVVFVGLVALVSGAALAAYAASAFSANQNKLAQTDLTQQERYAYEGSLAWWAKTNSSLYYPLAAILIVIGIIILTVMFVLRP
jgi:hypothetical protein